MKNIYGISAKQTSKPFEVLKHDHKISRTFSSAGFNRSCNPNLKAVFVGNAGNSYILIFCFEGEPSPKKEELASVADTEFIADFPDFQTKFKIILAPYPQRILLQGQYVYKRYEPLLNGEIATFETSCLNSQGNIREKNITQLLLSANRLLGKVTPNLRGSFIDEINNKIILTLCYALALSLIEEKIAALVENELCHE